jgi:hypothetical protein
MTLPIGVPPQVAALADNNTIPSFKQCNRIAKDRQRKGIDPREMPLPNERNRPIDQKVLQTILQGYQGRRQAHETFCGVVAGEESADRRNWGGSIRLPI